MLGQTCQQEAHHGQYDLHLCMPLQLGVKGWESKEGQTQHIYNQEPSM